ncbi:Prolyl 4-hydroxylase subunit alpha-1 [Nymphon striatum]|nr:Prolyl 4-hydroxylase subunit alpha-1 [Nymphon striatum]
MSFPGGDRLATMLFYLNDVKAGGYTVFPVLKIGVQPKKGSALFWYNLKKSGDGDPQTVHAACMPYFIRNKVESQMAAAAEKRQKEQEKKGIANPEALKQKQLRDQALEKQREGDVHSGEGLKWQVG